MLHSQGPPTSFEHTRFHTLYPVARAFKHQHELFAALHQLLLAYCAHHHLAPAAADAFFRALQVSYIGALLLSLLFFLS